MTDPGNVLYYGDNLDVLRRHVPDESVDLVYLDPPFNSNATYNVLFGHTDGPGAAAQIQAFDDTWHWDQTAAAAFEGVVTSGGDVAKALVAFRTLLGPSTVLAYLSMMAPRLVELGRVLKPSGSIYLHCDPTASHYLKLLLDAVFGAENFRNELIWRYGKMSNATRRFPRNHDTILGYTRNADAAYFSPVRTADSEYKSRFSRWLKDNKIYYGTIKASKDKLILGRIKKVEKQLKRSLHDSDVLFDFDREFKTQDDVFYDISIIKGNAAERLGYPTQKPEALLERIIESSCPPGGAVLDPFCGCGTTIAVAERLDRRWIGIDVTYLAIALIKSRLTATGAAGYKVLGEPTTSDDAAQLAADDPYQFQWWALGLIGARPAEGKKGADKGIDGRLFFFDGDQTPKQAIVSVKAGGVQVSHVRDLRGVLDREQAQLGVLISFKEPTQAMRQEAASADFYKSAWGQHPKLQLITVAELLDGKRIDMPAAGSHMTQVALPPTPEELVHPEQLGLGETRV